MADSTEIKHERQFLEQNLLAKDGSFQEYLPVDDFLDGYLEDLTEEDPVLAGPGQNKGARKPAEYTNGGTAAPARAKETGAKPKRIRNRNERQQMLNKLAQLRYRERKRQKAAALKGAVGPLAEQVAEQARLEEAAGQLAEQNRYLEGALAAKDAEIDEAKRAQQAPGTTSGSSGEASKARSAEEKKAELGELVQRWLDTVAALRKLLASVGLNKPGARFGSNGVPKASTDFSGYPPHAARDLHALVDNIDMHVDTVMQLCIQVLRLSGADIQAIMNANFDRCQTLQGWKEDQKWIKLARDLGFSTVQRDRVLEARTAMLQKLQRIYAERHQLNARAIGMLLPAVNGAGGDVAPGADLAEGERQALTAVLEALEENLRAEQRAVCEQEYITFKHLLTPFQGGLFVVKAFPDHCDCLALVNAVHQLHTDPEAGIQGCGMFGWLRPGGRQAQQPFTAI